jgi:phage repressor protein C with HTH and peptisase S24 domain
MEMHERIRAILAERGISNLELSRLTKIPNSTLANILKGETSRVSIYALFSIAEALDVSANYLMYGREALLTTQLEPKEITHIKQYRALDEHGQTVVKLVMDEETDRKTKEDAARAKSIDIAPEHETMRIYNQAAAAGLGCLLEDNSDIDYEEIEFLSDDIPYGTSFGIRIKGDSMEPTVPEGSIVWVKRQDEVEDGQIGVFVSATDGAICKRVRNDYSAPEGCITWFESINPKYPDMLPAEDTITGVVGRVLDAYTKGDK